MNEAETRAQLIDPHLQACGWGVDEDSRIRREYHITKGRIQPGAMRRSAEIADYVLVYRDVPLAVIEAKASPVPVSEAVSQAKDYGVMLAVDYTYATNGREIYEIDLQSGQERVIETYPTPSELWERKYGRVDEWKRKFAQVPYADVHGARAPYYYQEIAIRKVLEAVAEQKDRILLTLATGTGKTYIAAQIAWKLFQSRWTLSRDSTRRPRILFLADRNILANQAFNTFSHFPEDALVRINPLDIRKRGAVPMNGSIFFTIFQTFMSGPAGTPYFGDYPQDFFDCIIVDECHRGGANDEGNWRGILEHFSSAVQLGLTATPKRRDNIDTYRYFGDPVYTYSLKQGIQDGFLTPFKVKRVKTMLDDYIYTSDDQVIEGEVEEGRLYTEDDFNRIIVIKEREAKRVKVMMSEIDQTEKTLIFCANQEHAAAIRDLVNQCKTSADPHYCVRVTANDGERGDAYLRQFQDNEKIIPTILTTSQKLSTGVDARNVRNIVLLRPVRNMIEFKQIIGRGTRLFDGKEFFTIYDFVDVYRLFADPEWDGEPEDPIMIDSEPRGTVEKPNPTTDPSPSEDIKPRTILKIKLADGKERQIQHMMSISFWGADGRPVSAQEFIQKLFADLPHFFKTEDELRLIWSEPGSRSKLLEALAQVGYSRDVLENLQTMINANACDLYDVLSYISFAQAPISREHRVKDAESSIFAGKSPEQHEFLDYVLDGYIHNGVDQLSDDKLPKLLNIKYQSIDDAEKILGGVDTIRNIFVGFQKHLYRGQTSREIR